MGNGQNGSDILSTPPKYLFFMSWYDSNMRPAGNVFFYPPPLNYTVSTVVTFRLVLWVACDQWQKQKTFRSENPLKSHSAVIEGMYPPSVCLSLKAISHLPITADTLTENAEGYPPKYTESYVACNCCPFEFLIYHPPHNQPRRAMNSDSMEYKWI